MTMLFNVNDNTVSWRIIVLSNKKCVTYEAVHKISASEMAFNSYWGNINWYEIGIVQSNEMFTRLY